MSDSGQLLLLADSAVGDEMARRLGGSAVRRCGDPYDALMEMGRRRWPAVVLAASRDDFAGLCRASRRLQADARLYALCSPAGEVDVRPLVGRVLDDYFVYPPGAEDMAALSKVISPLPAATPAAAQSAVAAGAAGDEASICRQVAELIDAARSLSSLEEAVSAMVAGRLGRGVIWFDADKAPADALPLLLAAGEAPRVLVARGKVERTPPVEAFLSAVQTLLPSLVSAARRTETLHELAITDHLTGAYNRRYFYHSTDQILSRAGREGRHVTLLLYDIDNFKRYNDTYGYAAGDEIIREIVQLMKRTTRSQDLVARIGGDEFAVLFWEGDRPNAPNSRPVETAFIMAERFRRVVSRHEFPCLGPEARGALTISGGLASFPHDGQTCRDLLARADLALKDVKRTGKNAIRLVGG